MVLKEIDLPLPPLDLLECLSGEAGLAYLEGIAGPGGRRFTVLGYAPRATLKIRAEGTVIYTSVGGVPWRADPLAALDAFLAALPHPDDEPPFPLRDAAIGYLAYEARTAIERVPANARDDLGLPLAMFCWYDPLLIHDDIQGRYYLASTSSQSAVEERQALLLERLGTSTSSPCIPGTGWPLATALRSNMTAQDYRAAIGRIHDYIRAGDVYQINFAQRFSARLTADPLVLFARLTRRHPMPLSAYFDAGSFQILSNTPELFLDRQGTRIRTRPIKGTRRRGQTPEEDLRLRTELLNDPKERAEHTMIVDLERNDLGRICRPGTVQVRDFTRIQSYPTLHHMVSTVEGELESDLSVADLIRATFPGGSITGAPKIRAMEIIDALEPNARGVYTGALGIIDAAGDMHLSLAIRTAITTAGIVHYGSGGGIVADSDADAEYAESLLKAQAILKALELRPE